MLILHRRRTEALRIGKDIRIVVLESDGGGTRLGIEAPHDVQILREEIIDQVRAENLRASRVALEAGWEPLKPEGSG
ncbi:MAG: carbon storage regulator [Longimicrobiales bacterium]